MPEGRVVAEKDKSLGRVIFDNIKKHNAMSQAMWDQLAAAMKFFDKEDDIRVVVLEGAGEKSFVSGADISKFESERSDSGRIKEYGVSVERAYSAVQFAIKPTIAKIDGYCYGGGMGIAVCADLRICSENSSFCIPAAKLGVGYGHANTKVLLDLVGPAFTKEIFYTARRFSSQEALNMGLVNCIQPQEELNQYVANYVEVISNNAPLSVRATNLIVNELLKDKEERDDAFCRRLVEDCSDSQDIEEGRRAFMEKRRPMFVGH